MNEPWEDKQDREMREALEKSVAALKADFSQKMMEIVWQYRLTHARSGSAAVINLLIGAGYSLYRNNYFWEDYMLTGGAWLLSVMVYVLTMVRTRRRIRECWADHDRVVHGKITLPSYGLSEDGRSILCLKCGRISYSAEDVKNLYCGNCHRFHER